MREHAHGFGFLTLMLVAFAPPIIDAFDSKPPLEFARLQRAPETAESPVYEEKFVYPRPLTRFAHSPALAEAANGHLMLAWFGGTGEGSPSVQLFMSTYSPEHETWTKPRVVIDRDRAREEVGRFVYTIGNPALWTQPDGKLWLFYVTSWISGWSGSSINFKMSVDHGDTWTPTKRLVTSPYLNSGTLVRASPFEYSDGTIGLPIYHELLGIFPENVRLDPDGVVMDKSRIYYGKKSLQPSVVPLGDTQALALLRPRHSGKAEARVLLSRSEDAGRRWSTPVALDLANPGSSVVGLRASDDSILLAYNDSPTSRNDLSLARSVDGGKSWQVLTTVEHSKQGKQFAYPSFIQTKDGQFHLIYAWNYTHMKHVRFNAAWIAQTER